MTQTILDVLVASNPELDSSFTTKGPNTTGDDWIPVEGWRPWEDFTYENLRSIFKKQLSVVWPDPPKPIESSDYDKEIWNEQSLDYYLHRFVLSSINGALQQTSKALKQKESLYIAPGSWCLGASSSDWGLVSRRRMVGADKKYYWNLLPGDTKVHAKWRPSMEESQDDYEQRQWTLPLSQLNTYAAYSECRYGFIITDHYLVVLRFTLEYVGPGSSATRPIRVPAQTSNPRVASGSTDLSSVIDAMSLDSSGAHSYVDNHILNTEYQPPEFAVVKWKAKGSGRLTIRLALYCLCLMAAVESRISTCYPPLDSWREVERGYMHTTSGRFEKRLPSGASVTQISPGSPSEGRIEDNNEEQGIPVEAFPEEQSYGDVIGPEEEEIEERHSEDMEEDEERDQAAFSQSGPGPSRNKKVYKVTLKGKNGRYYFKDLEGKKVETKKSDWNQSELGWIYLKGEKTYLAANISW